MSFSNSSSTANLKTIQPALDASIQANLRLFLIGVSQYADPSFAPVSSASNNALAWLVSALRMGAAPAGNPFLLEEAWHPEELVKKFKATLEQADLDNQERAGLQHLYDDLEEDKLPKDWDLQLPTLSETSKALVYLGNHLDWNKKCRMLVFFSGHGALQADLPVLCLSDTTRVGDRKNAREEREAANEKRLSEMTKTLESRRNAARSEPERVCFAEGLALLAKMATVSRNRGMFSALLDIVSHPVADMGVKYRSSVILALLRRVNANLLSTREVPTGVLKLENALTVQHIRLALGDVAERVTLVIDACHSGGSLRELQGNTASHPWIDAGLNCRIISASATGGVAAEARIGERRQSAATWALTQVMSRWGRVMDGPTYALGIRNGDLVQRANLLLAALSFRQQLTLHSQPTSGGISAADLPFCGLDPATRTWSDPNAQADAVQVTGESTGLTEWKIYQGTTLRAVLLAVGGATDWSHTPADPAKPAYTYQKNQLYVLTRKADANALAGGSFEVKKYTWNGTGSPSQDIVSGVEVFNNTPWTQMPASNDPDEHSFGSATTLQNVSSQQIGNNKRVFLQWTASSGSTPPRLQILTKASFPFTPSDFAADGQAMSFPAGASETFPAGSWYRQIDLPNS